jgi:hypothetical protein
MSAVKAIVPHRSLARKAKGPQAPLAPPSHDDVQALKKRLNGLLGDDDAGGIIASRAQHVARSLAVLKRSQTRSIQRAATASVLHLAADVLREGRKSWEKQRVGADGVAGSALAHSHVSDIYRMPPYWASSGTFDSTGAVTNEPTLIPTNTDDVAVKFGPLLKSLKRAGAVVHRVENPVLWHQYRSVCLQMRAENQRMSTWPAVTAEVQRQLRGTHAGQIQPDGGIITQPCDLGLNEVYLFHGTSEATVHRILRHGFDPRRSKSHRFGHGAYFSPDLNKAAQYAMKMIVARAALGCATVVPMCDAAGKYIDRVQRMYVPPARAAADGGGGLHYDSVIGDRSHSTDDAGPTEFVVYGQWQAYPEYVIDWPREQKK